MECSVYLSLSWMPGGRYSLSWPIRGGSAQKGCPIQAPGIWEGKDFTEFEVSNQVIGSCWSISKVGKSLFPYVKGAKRANRRNMTVKKSEKVSFTTPSNINVIVLKLCWRGQQRRVHLLMFHPIITFLADRLWNNKRIKDILAHAKTPIWCEKFIIYSDLLIKMVSRNKPQNLQRVYELSKVLPPSNFAVFYWLQRLAQTP